MKTISHCTVALVLYQYIAVDGFTRLRFPAVRTGSEKGLAVCRGILTGRRIRKRVFGRGGAERKQSPAALRLYQHTAVDGLPACAFFVRTGNEKPAVCPRHLDRPLYPKKRVFGRGEAE